MIVHDMDQYSPEWWEIRKGIPTASAAAKILTPTGKLSTQSRTYINELIADSLGLGDPPIDPTEWMQRGTLLEPEARKFYAFANDCSVDEIGFITNDEGTAGCSPDGMIDERQIGWEVKCPKASTHIGYLQSPDLPAFYRPQVHMSMALSLVTDWIFMSYHPDLKPLVVKVQWDDYTTKVYEALTAFIENLHSTRASLGL